MNDPIPALVSVTAAQGAPPTAGSAPETTVSSTPHPPRRLTSIDAYRGLVMALMMGEALSFGRVADYYKDSTFWSFLDYHQSHVEWVGCSLHDLIQPSFSFLVGTALAFSVLNRQNRGQTFAQLFGHALFRSLALIFLGVFLRSIGRGQTYYTFEDTLSQIGLGYLPLFLVSFLSLRGQWTALVLILLGYWGAFALYPLPGPGFDWASAGVPPDWPHHLQGFAAHWNKNTNLAWAFDTWFLNLFPREKPFLFNGGGYSTLSFIPTLGTMILGLIAGTLLKRKVPDAAKIKSLLWIAAGCFGVALALHGLGICPIVKKIWTPSWTLFSGGWCFVFMAASYVLFDMKGWKWLAFPLVVIGMNSIAAYCMDHLWMGFIRNSLNTHLYSGVFKMFGPGFEHTIRGALALGILWLILFWMYRRRIFLRI